MHHVFSSTSTQTQCNSCILSKSPKPTKNIHSLLFDSCTKVFVEWGPWNLKFIVTTYNSLSVVRAFCTYDVKYKKRKLYTTLRVKIYFKDIVFFITYCALCTVHCCWLLRCVILNILFTTKMKEWIKKDALEFEMEKYMVIVFVAVFCSFHSFFSIFVLKETRSI